jgi:hypothetical protein
MGPVRAHRHAMPSPRHRPLSRAWCELTGWGAFATVVAAVSIGLLDRRAVPVLAVLALGATTTGVLGWVTVRRRPPSRRRRRPDRVARPDD